MNFFLITFTVLGSIIVCSLVLKFFLESDFERIDKHSIDLPKWAYQNMADDNLSKALQKSGFPKRMNSIYWIQHTR